MPLLATAQLVYIAGLLAAFGGLAAATLVVAAATLVAGAWRRSYLVAGLALTLAAGAVVGEASEREERACAAALTRSSTWRVVLLADAVPGRRVRVRGAECPAEGIVLVVRGSGDAGATVLARGELSPGARRPALERAALVVVRAPSRLDRWRGRAGRAVDRAFGDDAPLARALLVADTRAIPAEIRDQFAAAGLAHALSISGLHVGIIAVALEIAIGALRLGRGVSAALALLATAFYVVLIGAPPPAVRAALMLGVRTLSRAAQRPTSPWAILALGAAAPVVAPRVALDLGWQLSALGVAALIVTPRLARRIAPEASGWRREVLVGVIGSTLATVLTAPLVAWSFGRVSLAGPLVNIVAAPLVTLAQPMLFLALLLSPLIDFARFVAAAAHPLLTALTVTARVAAALPFAQLVVWPTLADALFAAMAVVAGMAAAMGWRPARATIIAALAIAGALWHPFARGGGLTELHMIDVGQGDALALRTPHGHWVLFDAGGAWRGQRGAGGGGGGDAGRSIVVPYVARRGGTVDAFVLSHPHTDHVGGAASVLSALRPALYIDAAFAAGNTAYASSLAIARATGTVWRRAHPGDSLTIDGVVLTVLAPDSVWTAGLTDPNLASTIVVVRAGERRFLLVGDAEAPEEAWVVAHAHGALRADVLKVGHHGSSTSSGEDFLDAVRPRVALVSVGTGNSYGHPSPSVMRALRARGARVLRTDLLGSIVVRTDGRRLWVVEGGESWEVR